MTRPGTKDHLHRYLDFGRDALLWKLEGLSEYDVRRPMTPTGTNLLGLVKHLSGVEAGYFGATFGRPFPERLAWIEEDAEDNADMWATPDESREDILGLYARVRAHADATITELPLDSPGRVPWWPDERADVTLDQILVHVAVEVHRHAGHADVARELIDGAVGMRVGRDNLPDGDGTWWHEYRNKLEQAAKTAAANSRT
ncbi:DinB family protein [Actinomadura rupiterrae]|uniref:DinB family protein n=1 Tax=Actinomadura rupiterrae TaxID=559627 RepID=UPI0020A350D3|nr:DinB family protein [Actinomadura rupiterrae]MCP2336217.1 putative damage-inducible protein DinB [Actinomadura rupiterrae]